MTETKEIKLSGRQILQARQQEQAKFDAVQSMRKNLQQMLTDTMAAEDALKTLESGKNQKILVSLGAGVYIETKIESAKTVKTGLGSDVLVDSTTENAIKALGKRKEEIRKDLASAQKDEAAVMHNLRQLGMAIESAKRKKAQEEKK